MLRSIDRSPGRRNRAVTLIEAVLYISIALALIVGGLVFFQQASTAARTSTIVRQLSAVLAEGRVLIKGLPVDGTPAPITQYVIAARAVPPDMVTSATTLSNPFGGETQLWTYTIGAAGQQVISIFLSNIPQGVCARLLTATPGPDTVFDMSGAGSTSTTRISSGYAAANVTIPGVVGPWVGFNMNQTQAGWMCKYGTPNYHSNKTVEPTSPPISGNVGMSMLFLVDR
jgi:hypothetical protein